MTTVNKAKDNSEVTGHVTVTSVRGGLAEKIPSMFARSRKRHVRFLERKFAGKLDLALPEDQQESYNSVCKGAGKY